MKAAKAGEGRQVFAIKFKDTAVRRSEVANVKREKIQLISFTYSENITKAEHWLCCWRGERHVHEMEESL